MWAQVHKTNDEDTFRKFENIILQKKMYYGILLILFLGDNTLIYMYIIFILLKKLIHLVVIVIVCLKLFYLFLERMSICVSINS